MSLCVFRAPLHQRCITNITSNSYPNTAGTALVHATTTGIISTHPPQSTKEKNKNSRRRKRGGMRCDARLDGTRPQHQRGILIHPPFNLINKLKKIEIKI
jgi:hypothetical protein